MQSPVWPSDKQLCEAARRAENGMNGGVGEALCMCVHTCALALVSMHSHARDAVNLSFCQLPLAT